MISAQTLVEQMLHPLEEVCGQMRATLSGAFPPGSFLFWDQWKCLAEAYLCMVGEIKAELLRLLEPVMAALHGLFSVIKAAQNCACTCLTTEPEVLRHILDRQVAHRYMDGLLTASTAVHMTLLHANYLNLLADARQGKHLPPMYSYNHDAIPSNGIPVLLVACPRKTLMDPYIMDPDNVANYLASASEYYASRLQEYLFYCQQDPHFHPETDPYNSQLRLIVHRLRDPVSVEQLQVHPSQFRKCDEGSGNLGKGGYGSVKLREWITGNHTTGYRVAVKMGTLGPNEIEIQAGVRHPNVLPLLCCTRKSVNDRTLLLVMERMDCNLDHLIHDARNGPSPSLPGGEGPPFPLEVSVEIMLQIAKGMEYLHAHRIMHRDLKPANILISSDHPTTDRLPFDPHLLRVKVADFGLSKDNFDSFYPNSAQVGTLGYRAPEVKMMDENGRARYSKKADVYSFGMVCYRILTGKEIPHSNYSAQERPSFEFEDSEATTAAVGCPKALVGMVEECWHVDASKRPDFSQIAEFLRFIKVIQGLHSICLVQKEQKADVVQRVDLFRVFRESGLSTLQGMLQLCVSKGIHTLYYGV